MRPYKHNLVHNRRHSLTKIENDWEGTWATTNLQWWRQISRCIIKWLLEYTWYMPTVDARLKVIATFLRCFLLLFVSNESHGIPTGQWIYIFRARIYMNKSYSFVIFKTAWTSVRRNFTSPSYPGSVQFLLYHSGGILVYSSELFAELPSFCIVVFIIYLLAIFPKQTRIRVNK